MKKRKILVGITLFLLTLCGCITKEITAAEDEVVIAVDIGGIEEDVYRVDLEYFLDEELMGGMAMSYADQTALRDRNIVFRLTPAEFPENASLSDFSFHVVLSFDQDGIEGLFSESGRISSTNPCEAFAADYGEIYRFTVAGSYVDGLVLDSGRNE